MPVLQSEVRLANHIIIAPQPSLVHNPPPAAGATAQEIALSDLIARADQYVSVGGDVATLDPAAKNALSATEFDMVSHLVASHNLDTARSFRTLFKDGRGIGPVHALSSPIHAPPILSSIHSRPGRSPPASPAPDDSAATGSTSQALSPPAACTPHVSVSYYWWGFRIHMDHCFVSLLKSFGGLVGPTTSDITAILAAAGVSVANFWIGLAVGIIATMFAWISWADGYCTPNSGANYNQSWTVQGWITTVC